MSARAYLELVRIPAVFSAPSDVLAGLAIAAAFGAALEPGAVALLLLASVAVYCAGMAANDVFDATLDAQERPGRPIPSGRVPLRAAWALVLGLQGLGLALAAAVSPPAFAAVGFTIVCTYAYNALLKDSPLGPWTMGACRYGNAAIGLSVAGWPTLPLPWLFPLSTLAYTAAVTFVSRHEVDGAARDDLRGPFAGLLVLALAPTIWTLAAPLPTTWAAALPLLTIAWLIGPLRRAWTHQTAGSVRGVVMAGIYGIALSNACLAAAAGGFWQAALAAGLLVPGRAFGRWFYAT